MAHMIGFGFFVRDVPTALDQVQRAARQPLGHVQADRLVAGDRLRQAPCLE